MGGGDLPKILVVTMTVLRAQAIATVNAVEKCIAQVEKRWTGAETVRDALLMNMRGRVIQMNRRTTVCDRAKQLLEGASYAPVDNAADEMVNLFFGRMLT